MADRETLDLDVAAPGTFERLDPVRGEDEIDVEGAVLQLNEVLAALDLGRLRLGQCEAEFARAATTARPFATVFSMKRSAS